MFSKDCDVSIIRTVLLKGLNDLMGTVAGAGLHDQEHLSSPRFHKARQQHPHINLFPVIMTAYGVPFLN